MRYDVHIRVCGEQYYEDAGHDASELEVQGTLTRLADGWLLSYEEESGDMAGTATELLVAEDRITLTRRGTLSSEMVFCSQRPHRSLYETPYGRLTMEIVSEEVRADLTERGGSIYIAYAIRVDGRPLGENKLRIQVKTTEDRG